MAFEKLNDLNKSINVAASALAAMEKEYVEKAFEEFFQLAPEAAKVVWTQYTPLWNDGDECQFSVNDFEVETDPQLGKFTHYKLLNQLYLEVQAYLRDIFGDHVQITATRSGFTESPHYHE